MTSRKNITSSARNSPLGSSLTESIGELCRNSLFAATLIVGHTIHGGKTQHGRFFGPGCERAPRSSAVLGVIPQIASVRHASRSCGSTLRTPEKKESGVQCAAHRFLRSCRQDSSLFGGRPIIRVIQIGNWIKRGFDMVHGIGRFVKLWNPRKPQVRDVLNSP